MKKQDQNDHRRINRDDLEAIGYELCDNRRIKKGDKEIAYVDQFGYVNLKYSLGSETFQYVDELHDFCQKNRIVCQVSGLKKVRDTLITETLAITRIRDKLSEEILNKEELIHKFSSRIDRRKTTYNK